MCRGGTRALEYRGCWRIVGERWGPSIMKKKKNRCGKGPEKKKGLASQRPSWIKLKNVKGVRTGRDLRMALVTWQKGKTKGHRNMAKSGGGRAK